MVRMRRCCRRRLLPYLICINFLVCMCYLMPLNLVVSPGAAMREEDIETQAILKALGPKGSNASALVLPTENTVMVQPNPNYCQTKGRDIYALFVVISSPGNFEARDATRANLKAGVNGFEARRRNDTRLKNTVLFFTGVSPDPDTQTKLEAEAGSEGDIVIDNLADTYLNMTVKILRMFKWVRSTCPEVKFLVKVDDDVHLNLLKLFQFLDSTSKNPAGSVVIGGHHYQNKEPVRSLSPPNGKWFAPEEVWPFPGYPDFIGGPAYILGFEAVQKIYERSLVTELFHLEDVFVTGIVANAGLHMKLTGIPNIVVYWPVLGSWTRSSCYVQNQFLIHSITPENLKCWSLYNTKDFVCDHWPLAISQTC